jgi:hypothetical protein
MSANPWDNVVGQLANRPGSLNLVVQKYNPKPAGVIRHGSTTHELLEHLQKAPARYFTHADLMYRLNCTRRALSWALIYLRSLGLVESFSDETRNARYLRYRLSGDSHAKPQISPTPQAGGVSVSGDAPCTVPPLGMQAPTFNEHHGIESTTEMRKP